LLRRVSGAWSPISVLLSDAKISREYGSWCPSKGKGFKALVMASSEPVIAAFIWNPKKYRTNFQQGEGVKALVMASSEPVIASASEATQRFRVLIWIVVTERYKDLKD